MDEKVLLGVRVDPEYRAKVKSYAALRRKTVNECVLEALDQLIEKTSGAEEKQDGQNQ